MRTVMLFVKSPVRDWAWLFVVINIFVTINGSVNPAARWATLAAMVEDHSFAIDRYIPYTCDWARPPSGHYFSNKAPGPVLLGYPLFKYIDSQQTEGLQTREARDARRGSLVDDNMHTLSIFLQVIPLAIATLLLVGELQKLGVPLAALHLTAVAILFGNTASLFANTYFGHTMSATLVLLTLYAVQRRMPLRIGIFYGLAVLSDYSCLLLSVPLLIALALTRQFRWRAILRVVAGGIAPALTFAAYHKSCFGSPFTLGQKYVNPVFVDVKSEPALWGVFRINPNMKTVSKLLYSPERGLAYTQPWVLVCLLLMLVVVWIRRSDAAQQHMLRWLTAFILPGFVLIMWMNSSFGGWHGGATCGPRYLSAILPVIALSLPLIYVRVPGYLKQLLFVTMVPGLVLYVLVQSTKHVLAPELPLIEYYFDMLLRPKVAEHLFAVMLILMGAGWATYRAIRSVAEERLQS